MLSRLSFTLIVCFFITVFGSMGARADDDKDAWSSFISGYYSVPQTHYYPYYQKGVGWEDIATGLLFSKLTGVRFETIMAWRTGGLGWVVISDRIRLPHDKLFVVLPPGAHVGPPYGKAYGYWKKRGGYVLTDADIHNLVLLRATSEYYKVPPAVIISQRESGVHFTKIIINEKTKGDSNKSIDKPDHVKADKGNKEDKDNGGPPSSSGRGKGKHKNK